MHSNGIRFTFLNGTQPHTCSHSLFFRKYFGRQFQSSAKTIRNIIYRAKLLVFVLVRIGPQNGFCRMQWRTQFSLKCLSRVCVCVCVRTSNGPFSIFGAIPIKLISLNHPETACTIRHLAKWKFSTCG